MGDDRYSEKRKYERLDKTVITWFKPTEDPPEGSIGFDETLGRITKNIAAGGILFETDEPVPVSTLLNLEIKLPNVQKVIRATGRVVRVEELDNKRYDLGIYFLEIDSSDKECINKFINKQE